MGWSWVRSLCAEASVQSKVFCGCMGRRLELDGSMARDAKLVVHDIAEVISGLLVEAILCSIRYPP